MTSRQDSLQRPETADCLPWPAGPSQPPVRNAHILATIAILPALELGRRFYRWGQVHAGLRGRAERLRSRLGGLPRAGVGLALADIDPALDKRIAGKRRSGCELVIGDFDQDGGIAPRFGGIAGLATLPEGHFMPRSGCPVLLVDLGGRLGVRKQFRSFARFVLELEAMAALEPLGCAIPRLMNVNWESWWITSEFVLGDVVRELLAAAGADIRDRDSDRPPGRKREAMRVRAGRALVASVLSRADVSAIGEALAAIHRAGFVLEDVKFGNIILQSGSRRPVFVDFERALPVRRLPRLLADYLRGIDVRKLRDHFGDWPGSPPEQA